MVILVIGVGFLLLVIGITAIETQSNGFFTQKRIGQYGKSFLIYKLRTLHAKTNKSSFWG
jgi:lipopolysaccharide/colanic/teichoic acid biosynthesis glycosyltransferase